MSCCESQPDSGPSGAQNVPSGPGGVDEGVCRPREVVAQAVVVLGGEPERVDGVHHVQQPAVAHVGRDLEGHVPHPQARVTALLGVGRRAAPVLLEEHPEALLGRAEVVLGVEGAQRLVLGDAAVELAHELGEGLVAAEVVVVGHVGQSPRAGVAVAVGCRASRASLTRGGPP